MHESYLEVRKTSVHEQKSGLLNLQKAVPSSVRLHIHVPSHVLLKYRCDVKQPIHSHTPTQ